MRVSGFIKDLMTTSASQVGVLLFGVVLLRIMTAVLDEKSFGLFILMRRWIVVLLPVVTLNLSMGLARYVSFEKEKARFFLHISLIVATGLTVLVFIVLVLFNRSFSVVFFESVDYSNLVFLLAFFLFAHMIELITYSYFRGKMDMDKANILRLVFMGFPVLLAGIFFILGIDDYSFILNLYFFLYACWGVICSLYFLRGAASPTYSRSARWSSLGGVISKVCRKNKVPEGIKKREKASPAYHFGDSRGLIKYSLVRIPSLIFISLIFSFPVIMASHNISVTAAGYVGIVVSVLNLLTIFSMPFNLIFLPKFSSLIKNKQLENIKNYSLVILDFIFTFLPIVVVMLFGLTRYIVLLWFGPKYMVTVNSVAAAILVSVFYLGFALIRGVLNGLFEFPYVNIINLAGFVTVGVLCVSMGTGIFELSAALCCGLFILGVASIFVLVKKLRLSFPWLKVLTVLAGCGLLFLLLTVTDNMLTGLKLNTWYMFILCLFYRFLLLVLVWWFYWRKTVWYNEMIKRINIKGRVKEDVLVYGD